MESEFALGPKMAKVATMKEIFRPSAPTQEIELFQGRARELEAVISGMQDLGQHVVVYGDRGVGKTSLSLIATGVFLKLDNATSIVVRVQCTLDLEFSDVWRKFLKRFREEVNELDPVVVTSLSGLLSKLEDLAFIDDAVLGVEDVTDMIRLIARDLRMMVVIDEFDRLGGGDKSVPFADLIKNLADERVRTTLIIVGVSNDVEGLIQGHKSISRAIRQVEMPRMSQLEVRSIVTRGYETYRARSGDDLKVDDRAAGAIAHVAQGLPYYAHLLAGAAGSEAIRRDLKTVNPKTVFEAMVGAIGDAAHDIKVNYQEAITARADARFETTLLACALAEVDHLGYFSSKWVSDALSSMTGRHKAASDFNHHLKRFAEDPINILETRRSGPRIVRYRFRDPLMKPFVLMKGIQSGAYPVDELDAG